MKKNERIKFYKKKKSNLINKLKNLKIYKFEKKSNFHL